MEKYFLSTEDLMRVLDVSRTQIYRLDKLGRLPPKRQISENKVGWVATEIRAWLESLPVRNSEGANYNSTKRSSKPK